MAQRVQNPCLVIYCALLLFGEGMLIIMEYPELEVTPRIIEFNS